MHQDTQKESKNQTKRPPSDQIAEMAIQFKIEIFPCSKDKKPLIKDWQKQATFDPQKIAQWQKEFSNLGFWGMPTNRFFALDQDGENTGKVKNAWIIRNPYTQKTPSGWRHWLFKNPQAKVKNKVRFSGDFDIRGAGGYICLYHLIFSSFQLPEDVPAPTEDLLKLIGSGGNKESWKKGARNNTLNKKVYEGAQSGDTKTILKAVFEGARSGLSWEETQKTTLSGLKAGGGMPRLNGADQIRDTINPKGLVTLSNKIIAPEPVKTITPLGFPTGSITVFGGGQGEGKTTTILKSGAKNSKDGDGRPMLIFTRENSINNLILPWWAQFGGVKGKLSYPTHPDFPKPEMVSWKVAKSVIIEGCRSGYFSLVFVDLVYLMVRNELENKEYETTFLEVQNNLHHSTAFVCTAHLKKDVKDQPLLHHFRGGTDLTGIPDRIMYLRRGKNATQRVVIKLKDRATGDLTGGFITQMENKKSDISIETVAGSPKQILKNHAEALVIEKSENQKEDTLIDIVRRKVTSCSEQGTLSAKDYLDWATSTLNIGENKARFLLKKAGFDSKKRGKAGNYMIRPI